jgi:hypothetical protein
MVPWLPVFALSLFERCTSISSCLSGMATFRCNMFVRICHALMLAVVHFPNKYQGGRDCQQ